MNRPPRQVRRYGAALAAVLAAIAVTGAACAGDDSVPSPPDAEPATQSSAAEPAQEAPTPTPQEDETDYRPNETDEVARERAEVLRVIDGDTIEVRLVDGTVDRVRYIGIDTPETVAPGQPVEPFGPEASAFNADLLSSNFVLLERDISERDRFDRLLRYVFVLTASGETLFVNEELVRAGLAVVNTFPPDVKYVDRFIAAQDAAQRDGFGIWADPPFVELETEPEPQQAPEPEPAPPPPPAREPDPEPTPATSPPATEENCDPSYPSVCIPLGAADYDCAGGSGNGPNYIRGPIRVLPPDPHGLDRDRDGVGCE